MNIKNISITTSLSQKVTQNANGSLDLQNSLPHDRCPKAFHSKLTTKDFQAIKVCQTNNILFYYGPVPLRQWLL